MSNTGAGGVAAGWYGDPYGRHQTRYWDGATWTDQVADNGVASVEGRAAPPPAVAPVAVVTAAPTPNLPWPGMAAPGSLPPTAAMTPPGMTPPTATPAPVSAPGPWSPSGQMAPGAPFTPSGPPPGGTPGASGGKPWFKKPLVWIVAALVVAGGVVAGVVVLGGDDAPPALSEATFHDQLAALCSSTAAFNPDSADATDPAAQAKVLDSFVAQLNSFSTEVGKLRPPTARVKAVAAYRAELTKLAKVFSDLKVQVLKKDATKATDIITNDLPAVQAGLDSASADLGVTECSLNT